MRNQKIICLWLTGGLILSGCQATVESHLFPQRWPASLARPGGKAAPALEEKDPALLVEAFVLDIGQPSGRISASEGVPTAQVLKDLLVQQLNANGVRVYTPTGNGAGLDDGLSCVVSRLGYTIRSGYPRQVEYFTELVCALRDLKSQRVLWEQTLEQVFEHKVLVNTMTRLPTDPYAHEEMLIQRCVLPVWDAMAERVKLSLKESSSVSSAALSEP